MVLLGTLCGSEGNCVSEAMVSNGGSELSASESKYSSSYAEFPSSDAKKYHLSDGHKMPRSKVNTTRIHSRLSTTISC
jgi:hypothetical protein